MVNKAVFLDRDGTMAENIGYCRSPEDFRLLSRTVEAVKLLNQHAFKLILITNQSGIGRGYFTEGALARIHRKMKEELAREGAYVDAIYYCPHHPDDDCDCRKPKPKLVLRAAKEHDIDLKRSFIVGDEPKDIELGRAVGCRTILVKTPPSISEETAKPDMVVADLYEAAQMICQWDDNVHRRSL